MPDGTFFLYTRAPSSADNKPLNSAEDASQFLLLQEGISTVPWDDAGPYLRFSATFEAGDINDRKHLNGNPDADEQVFIELDRRLKKHSFVFQ